MQQEWLASNPPADSFSEGVLLEIDENVRNLRVQVNIRDKCSRLTLKHSQFYFLLCSAPVFHKRIHTPNQNVIVFTSVTLTLNKSA